MIALQNKTKKPALYPHLHLSFIIYAVIDHHKKRKMGRRKIF